LILAVFRRSGQSGHCFKTDQEPAAKPRGAFDSQLITCRYGSPLEGIRSIAFLAKGPACSSVCRLSAGSAIHSRMIFRRISCSGFMLKALAINK
jgi:hypothetical protein